MRTLLVLLFLAAVTFGGWLDARESGKDKTGVLWQTALALLLGLGIAYILLYHVGVFKNWKR